MGVDKETAEEMPPTYDEANPLTSGEPNVKITSNETKIEIGKEKEKEAFEGLTKEELMKYANDPFWVRLRWILLILFWLVWLGMLAASIVIIIYADKCPSPEPKEWWQKNAMYKVDVPDFGDGTLAGLKENLDILVESGVGTIYLTSFVQTATPGTRDDVTDYKSIDSNIGSLAEWKSLVAAIKERDQKVVIDFIPNHTSEHHAWFEQSVAKDGKFKDYDIWLEGSSSPNASAWSYNDERGAWYQHRQGPGRPDLNLANKDVIRDLEKIIEFWMETGVNGFVVNDVEILVDNVDTTETLESILTKFRDVVNAETENTGVPHVLMTAPADHAEQAANYYGDGLTEVGAGNLVQLPLYTQQIAQPSDATALKQQLDQFISSLPANAWPNYGFQSDTAGPDMIDAMNMLKMMLPGTPLFTPGDELGIAWSTDEARSQLDQEDSHLRVFSSLASKMRHQESILFGELNKNTSFVMDNVFGITRVKKGNPGYLLLINMGSDDTTVDVSCVQLVPASIRLMTRSVEETPNASAWSYNDERGAWYLHRQGPGRPDLNLANKDVIRDLEKIIEFWMETGV